MSLVLLVLEAVGLHKLAVPFDVFGGKNLRQTERKLEGRKLSNSDHQTTYTAHVRGRRASGMWAALTLEKIVEGFAAVVGEMLCDGDANAVVQCPMMSYRVPHVEVADKPRDLGLWGVVLDENGPELLM